MEQEIGAYADYKESQRNTPLVMGKAPNNRVEEIVDLEIEIARQMRYKPSTRNGYRTNKRVIGQLKRRLARLREKPLLSGKSIIGSGR